MPRKSSTAKPKAASKSVPATLSVKVVFEYMTITDPIILNYSRSSRARKVVKSSQFIDDMAKEVGDEAYVALLALYCSIFLIDILQH